MKKEPKKVVSIRLTDEILKKLDSYAYENGFTRSTAISFLINSTLPRKEEQGAKE